MAKSTAARSAKSPPSATSRHGATKERGADAQRKRLATARRSRIGKAASPKRHVDAPKTTSNVKLCDTTAANNFNSSPADCLNTGASLDEACTSGAGWFRRCSLFRGKNTFCEILRRARNLYFSQTAMSRVSFQPLGCTEVVVDFGNDSDLNGSSSDESEPPIINYPSESSSTAMSADAIARNHEELLARSVCVSPKEQLYLCRLEKLPEYNYSNSAFFFSSDDELIYENFFDDFGPLKLGDVCRYCHRLERWRKMPQFQGRKIVHVTSSVRHKCSILYINLLQASRSADYAAGTDQRESFAFLNANSLLTRNCLKNRVPPWRTSISLPTRRG